VICSFIKKLHDHVPKFNVMFVMQHIYDRVNNSVFRRFSKVSSDVDDVTVGGRLFHTQASTTGNARSPIDEYLVLGTVNDAVDDGIIQFEVSLFEA